MFCKSSCFAPGTRERVLWSRSGSQGSEWVSAQVSVSSRRPHRLVLRGTWGAAPASTISLDDVEVLNVPCGECGVGRRVGEGP